MQPPSPCPWAFGCSLLVTRPYFLPSCAGLLACLSSCKTLPATAPCAELGSGSCGELGSHLNPSATLPGLPRNRGPHCVVPMPVFLFCLHVHCCFPLAGLPHLPRHSAPHLALLLSATVCSHRVLPLGPPRPSTTPRPSSDVSISREPALPSPCVRPCRPAGV